MAYIGHLIINISDYEKSKDFYDTIFQQMNVESRIVHEDDNTKIKAYQIPGCPFYIRWSGKEEKKPFVRNTGLDHFCIGVDTEDEVNKLYETVKTLGVKITIEPKKYPSYGDKYYAFYFRDSDGFPLEIVYK
jgi:catechol 2,3-dioxygenase-like lactoylglutathione lyase family enzyme